MKTSLYNILKARFLINHDAVKNWRFIVFIILLAIIMIANTQRYEQKVFKIAALTSQVKELRSEFVDRRSQLMKLRMEFNLQMIQLIILNLLRVITSILTLMKHHAHGTQISVELVRVTST